MTDKETTETAVEVEASVPDEAAVFDAPVETEAAVEEQALTEEAETAAPEIAVTIPEDTAENDAAPTEVPERPWTPSYSVITQGPGTTEDVAQPEEEAVEAETEVEAEEAAPVTEEPLIPEVSCFLSMPTTRIKQILHRSLSKQLPPLKLVKLYLRHGLCLTLSARKATALSTSPKTPLNRLSPFKICSPRILLRLSKLRMW